MKFKALTNFLVVLLSLLFFAGLVSLCNATWWPKKFWWIPNLVSIFPLWLLYFPAAVLLAFGISLKRTSLIFLNSLSILLIFFCVMGWNIPVSKVLESRKQESLTLLTINLGNRPRKLHVLEQYIIDFKPDIILFQESGDYVLKHLRESVKPEEWHIDFEGGLGIISRYPIVDKQFRARSDADRKGTFMFEYTVSVPDGQIHLFNVHLQTPRKGLEPLINSGPGAYAKMIDITRGQEKESHMASQIASARKNVLVAGDFNMSRLNPIFKTYWSQYQDAHSRTGWGFGYTKTTGWHGIRIDHVLADENWQVVESGLGPDIGSDHRPLYARLAFVGEVEEVSAEPQPEAVSAVPSSDNYYDDDFESKGGASTMALPFAEPWPMELYPRVRFSYKVSPELPLGVRVQTLFKDWICLGGTSAFVCPDTKSKEYFDLVDDGQWHTIDINADRSVKSVLSSIKEIKEWQFSTPVNDPSAGDFQIEKFSISK